MSVWSVDGSIIPHYSPSQQQPLLLAFPLPVSIAAAVLVLLLLLLHSPGHFSRVPPLYEASAVWRMSKRSPVDEGSEQSTSKRTKTDGIGNEQRQQQHEHGEQHDDDDQGGGLDDLTHDDILALVDAAPPSAQHTRTDSLTD